MSFWQCQSKQPWSPFDPDCPADFTPCFEDTVLKLIPIAFLFLAGIPRLSTQVRQPRLSRPSTNWHQWVKVLGIALLITVTSISSLRVLLLGQKHTHIGMETVAGFIEIIGFIFALVLAVIENSRSFRSSNVLLVFWLLVIVSTAIKLRTVLVRCPIDSNGHQEEDSIEECLVSVKFVLSALVFALECVRKDAGIRLGQDMHEKCPEDEANIFSVASFHWVTGLMSKGYARPLTMDDLWALRKEDESKNVSLTFAEAWERELGKPNPSLVRALSTAFGKPFYIAGLWKAINDVLGFAQPVLLKEMLRFVMSYKKGEQPQPINRGYTIACLMFVCSLSQTTVLHQYFHLCFRTGMHIRAGLVTAIYQKSLRLSNSARQEFTVGEIVNHMSIDAQRVQDLVTYLHVVWSGLFQIAIALYLLYDTMGWAIFAGVAIMICTIPLNARLSVYMKNFQQQQMKNKDTRIKLMNEILNGIRVIKLYAWEGTFLQKVLTVRNDHELATMKKIGYLSAVQSFTWACTPFMVSLSTFTVYALIMKRPMTTDIVFPSIALFNLLQFPLAMFPNVISSSVEAYVAMGRVYKFLTSAEVDPDAIIVEDCHRSSSDLQSAADKYTIIATDASYSWYKNGNPVISGINFALKKDSLLTVIGRVGSGKSSLVAALCGDLERVSGEIRIRGSVAFVPQQAWIMNDTLRANILFGNTYDPVLYEKTIEACCLQPDFDMLLGGDTTEIGERGINLSGGQKARISLARAVYAQADIYLFDDILAAVDAHVGRTIFDKVVGPKGMLKNKTRVFVTHQIQYLSQSTQIMLLKDGKVVEQGDYQELMNNASGVCQLVREYGLAHSQEITEDPSVDDQVFLEEDIVERQLGSNDENSFLSTTPRSLRRGSIKSTASNNTLLRRPSVVSTRPPVDPKATALAKPNSANLMSEEQMKQGSVSRSVYLAYAKACSYTAVISYFVSMVLSQASSIATSLWLTYWSSKNDAENNQDSPLFYIGIYALLGVTYASLTVFQAIILQVHCGIRSARVMHQEMLHSVLRSPMMFFDTTPMGRILNRFSKDQSIIDEVLPRSFSGYFRTMFQVIAVLVVVTLSTPSFVVVIVPFGLIYLWLQRYFLATSRELRRLDSVSRSPVFAHFQETLGGISTIRAYRQQNRFVLGNEHRLDQNLRAFYPSIAGNRWLAFRLEVLSSVIIFGSAFLSVVSLARGLVVNPGLVGLSLSYALNITQTMNWMVRQYSEIESNIVSVERLKEYVELPQEAPEIVSDHRPPQHWPDQGHVDFVNYETRYRPGLELVLRGVNCSIRSHEKIGICGRTGAGKSSLTLSLFRIIESVRGQIIVDGVDISALGLYDVRSRFSIIPQDPVLFAGTIRFNLDPLGTRSDVELWQALEDSYFKEYVSQMEGGLNGVVLEQGENFSVGQRQLICLARALLRKTSLLVLDEATAAIDLETDALVQKIIRQKFCDCTILTIAHRINTVMDSDRIMVLDQGQVAEFDTPANLLADPGSIFYSLAKQSGNA